MDNILSECWNECLNCCVSFVIGCRHRAEYEHTEDKVADTIQHDEASEEMDYLAETHVDQDHLGDDHDEDEDEHEGEDEDEHEHESEGHEEHHEAHEHEEGGHDGEL